LRPRFIKFTINEPKAPVAANAAIDNVGTLPNRRATYRTITPQLAAHFAISLDREILIICGHQGQCPAGIPA